MIDGAQQALRRRVPAAGLVLALLASLIPVSGALAANALTAATGGTGISNDTTTAAGGTGTYTILTGPVVTGTMGTLDAGSITLTIDDPTEFEFNGTSGLASLTAGGPGECGTLALQSVSRGFSTFTIGLGGDSTGTCTVTFTDVQVRPKLANAPASSTITATGIVGGVAGVLSTVPGAPILTFNDQPSAANTGGTPFGTQPEVISRDQFGNTRFGDPITLAIAPGTGTAGAVLTCTTNPLATFGEFADFAGCKIDRAGTGYRLRASTPGASSVDSNLFVVNVGPAAHLAFTSYPANPTPALLAPQPTVTVQDAGNNTVIDTRTITLSINMNAGTFMCTGGLSRPAVAGVAAFSGCTQTVAGSGYTLTASDGGMPLPNITGPAFSIVSGLATRLAICWGTAAVCNTSPPSPNNGGTAFSAQPTVRILDAADNIAATDNTTVVTLAIATGTPSSGGPGTLTCTGGNSKTATAGVATFAGCTIDRVGTGYRLTATSNPVLTAATTNAFNVVAGPAAKLTFTSTLGNAPANTNFPTNPTVAITDLGGNVITSGISATIALSIGTNPGGGTLTCTGGNSATTSNGVATFTGCKINNPGTGYTLLATTTSVSPPTVLAPATSTPFTIGAAGAEISLATNPPSGVIRWGEGVIVTAHFATNGAARTFQLQASKDNATWFTIATLTTDGTGDASLAYRPSDNRHVRAVFGGAADLSPGTSPSMRVLVRQLNLLRPTNSGGRKVIADHTVITFRSTIRPNRPELRLPRANFVVYELNGSRWVKILDRIVDVDRATGVAVLSVTFNTVGQFYVRSQAVPTPTNANSGWSPVERFDVR